jgi:S-formylglutathione hydrolase FrmB
VVPAAPDGDLFFERGDRVFPEFLKKILADYKIRDGTFHIAGVSNGGISAFHVAASYPVYFLSIAGFPGYLPDDTSARAGAISKMCVDMHVGSLDTDWLDGMRKQAGAFRARGMKVVFTVEKNQPHRIETLAGDGAARLFQQFEDAQRGCSN